MHEQLPIFLRPFTRDIIVAKHGQYPPEAGLELGQDGGVTDVTAMDGQITLTHDILNARIECAMSIGEDGDTHPIHARNLIRKSLT